MTDPINPWQDAEPDIHAGENPWDDAMPDHANFAPDGAPLGEADDDIANNIIPGRIEKIDFWEAIRRNRRNTIMLVVCMLALAGGFGYILGWAWDFATKGQLVAGMQYMASRRIDWITLILTPSEAGIKLGLSLLCGMAVWSAFALLRADRLVLSMADADEVTEEEIPQLHHIIEEIALAAGLPKPKIYLVDNAMPNAFATGLRSDRAAVGVTTGLLDRLNRRELQGVMAHEMGHVLNGDMRYATLMAVMTSVLVLVAQIVLNSQRFIAMSAYGNRRDENGRSGGNPLAMLIMAVIFIVAAILVPILARVIQMAISRQREYLADATAVQLTRDPGGLISALQKIAASETTPQPMNNALEPLLFMTPEQMLHNGHRAWFSTHPPVESRIERLKSLE